MVSKDKEWRRASVGGLAFALLAFALLAVGCGNDEGGDSASTERPPPLVKFVNPVQEEIISWDEYTGRLEAVDHVEVRARVGGMLKKIHFEDGATVEKGDLLFSIDPRTFEADLAAARAELEQAKASRKLAQSNLKRGRSLLERDAISKEEVDARGGTYAEAEAGVQAAQARVERAELQLSFTKVHAPVDGRVSDEYVSEGNLISGGSAESTLLTTIVSIDPIHCRIEADEGSVLKYMRLAQSGERESARESRIRVEMGLTGEEGYPRTGYINFVDNAFDTDTATLRARAIFENEDRFLTPGMFARVRLPGTGKFLATLVPLRAVQTQQDSTSLLLVDGENRVRQKTVKLGPVHEGDRQVIETELDDDARVIVSGIQAARPGEKVRAEPLEPRSVDDASEGEDEEASEGATTETAPGNGSRGKSEGGS